MRTRTLSAISLPSCPFTETSNVSSLYVSVPLLVQHERVAEGNRVAVQVNLPTGLQVVTINLPELVFQRVLERRDVLVLDAVALSEFNNRAGTRRAEQLAELKDVVQARVNRLAGTLVESGISVRILFEEGLVGMRGISTLGREAGSASLDAGVSWDESLSQAHSVQFYEDDDFLVDGLSRFIGAALLAGDSAVVIATKYHRNGLTRLLTRRGLDLMPAVKRGQYLTLDAAETLSKFMVDGLPDGARFSHVIGSVISQLRSAAQPPQQRVAAFGEMVALLWAEGKWDAAIQLEQLWNELAQTHSFHLHCAYPIHFFAQEKHGELLQMLCSQHSHVVPTEAYTTLASDEQRRRSVIFLQQKAQALETEIRERKEADQLRLESEERLRLAQQVAGIGSFEWNIETNVARWTPELEVMHGLQPGGFAGTQKAWEELLHPDDRSEVLKLVAMGFETGAPVQGEWRVVWPDGSIHWIAGKWQVIRDDSARPVRVTGASIDVTQQKKLEENLRTSEKLAAVGRLAATIAHEINNPLEAVTNLIYLARKQPDLPDKLKNYLGCADRELRRVSHIARQTLGFYRDSSQPVEFRVASATDDVLTIYSNRLKNKALHIEKRIQRGLTACTAQGEFKQILSNLIANAIDACNERGRILIRARATRHLRAGGDGIRVTIADDGVGISPENKRRLFSPFFTTKEEVGTGLGLWVTKDLIEKRGGSIRFRSQIRTKSGTIMSFFVPKQFTPLHKGLIAQVESGKTESRATQQVDTEAQLHHPVREVGDNR
jgi:PAS domain S-box-containing protein